MKLVLFDLDDTLLAGDTEGEWVKFMIDNGMVKDASFLEKMAIFTGNYRNGRLDIYEYSNFLLGPLSGINELDLKKKVEEFSKKVVEKLSISTQTPTTDGKNLSTLFFGLIGGMFGSIIGTAMIIYLSAKELIDFKVLF